MADECADEAIPLLQRAVALRSTTATFHLSLGCALEAADRLSEARETLRRAIALDPGCVAAHDRLGCTLEALGDAAGAIGAFDDALRIDPQSVDAHCNRAFTLLSIGEFARGWEEYEWRWKRPANHAIRQAFALPWWEGGDISGRTILLFAEQGFGDAIQFVRYAPRVAARGARVVLGCPPALHELFKGVAGVHGIISDRAQIARHELGAPLYGLGRLLGMPEDLLGADVPYLAAPPARAAAWRQRLGPRADGSLRVGLAWASNPAAGYAWRKSISLDLLAPLAAVAGVTYYSLQTGAAAEHAAASGRELVDFTDDLRDFADTATLIAGLDLVISIDTAVAHLAGAMGRPVWTLLRRGADWRWQRAGERSAWYPTMRLFRQKIEGDWSDVVNEVARELRAARHSGV